MNLRPIELANAKQARAAAWDEYMQVIDREHTPAEFDEALTKAEEANTTVSAWYQRWQAVGGTSDITSIVEAEKNAQTYVPKFNPFLDDPGEVVELGSKQWYDDQPERPY